MRNTCSPACRASPLTKVLRALRLVRVRRVTSDNSDEPALSEKSPSIKRSVSGKSQSFGFGALPPVDTSIGIASVRSAKMGAPDGSTGNVVWLLEEWHDGNVTYLLDRATLRVFHDCDVEQGQWPALAGRLRDGALEPVERARRSVDLFEELDR